MIMDNLKKIIKVVVSIFVVTYKLVAVLIFLLMVFSPETYMKLINKIVDLIYAIISNIKKIIYKTKKTICESKGEYK